MPLSILFRRRQDYSPFRTQLHRLVNMVNNGTLILCTGYITEQEQKGYYGVLGDELLTALENGCYWGSIKTIAGKFGSDNDKNQSRPSPTSTFWLTCYRTFVERIEKAGLAIDAYIATELNWHAKIAICLDSKKEPIAAIIGSSNLTGPAYGINRGWNYECDVTIWRPDVHLNNTLGKPDTDMVDFEFLSALVNSEVAQPNEIAFMNRLKEDVEGESSKLTKLKEYKPKWEV